MKHLLVLTSLFALSACGGGFFDWYYYEKPEETALDETPTANPANTAVTQITTDLNNVDFRASDGMLFHFTLYDGVIDGASNGKEWHATRVGDSNVFVDDNTGDRWDIDTYGDGDLRYSDFGIKHKEYDSDSYTVFAGGDTEKLRNVYTPSEIEAIKNKEAYPDIVFTGTAVGFSRDSNGSEELEAETKEATLRVSADTFNLNMPFNSNGNGGFYDVNINGKYDYANGVFINDASVELSGELTSGGKYFDISSGHTYGVKDLHVNSYGDTTANEAAGWVRIDGHNADYNDVSFDAAFGVSKK